MSEKKPNIHNPSSKGGGKTNYHPNGRVWYKTPFLNGKQHGAEIRLDDNGQKRQQKTWREDKLRGLTTEWYDNGQKWWQEIWRDGKQHGINTGWRDNGAKITEVCYFRGEAYARMEWNDVGRVLLVNFPPTLDR